VIEKNIFLIADEIYEKFIYDSLEFNSVCSFGERYKKNLIIINGVSKTYAMTGWRIGFAVAPREVVSGMNKLQSHSTSNACTISQYAALEALTGPQEIVMEQYKLFEERRNIVQNILSKIDLISFIEPHGAFYIFVNIKKILERSTNIENSKEFCIKLLDEAYVATVPGSVFGMEGYLRISLAKSKDQLMVAMERIKKMIESVL